MTFVKKLNTLFLFIISMGIVLLIYSWYSSYQFDNNPISKDIQDKIAKKEYEILRLIKKHYNVNLKVPLTITNKMNSKLFGMAIFDTKTNSIKIYLNKKRFKESLDYMLKDVLPHEYAHALMFNFGDFSNINGGHTLAWEKACLNLNGVKCDRFVNHNDIAIEKTNFFK